MPNRRPRTSCVHPPFRNPPLARSRRDVRRSLYWRSKTRTPLGASTAAARRGTGPPRCSRHREGVLGWSRQVGVTGSFGMLGSGPIEAPGFGGPDRVLGSVSGDKCKACYRPGLENRRSRRGHFRAGLASPHSSHLETKRGHELCLHLQEKLLAKRPLCHCRKSPVGRRRAEQLRASVRSRHHTRRQHNHLSFGRDAWLRARR